jgi:hypothetical protein
MVKKATFELERVETVDVEAGGWFGLLFYRRFWGSGRSPAQQ